MIKGPKLNQRQWKILSSALSNIAQAILLFSGAAFFVPETVGLSISFSRITAIIFFFAGLLILTGAVILGKRGDR